MHKNIYHITPLVICLISAGAAHSESDMSDQFEELKFHAIYSENLRDIMHRMNQLVYEKELNELEKKEIRVQHLQSLLDTVNELVVASESLTEALPGFDLNKDEQDIFQAMAKQLQIEANNIRKIAEKTDHTNMELAYKRLNDTCAACHELFRF